MVRLIYPPFIFVQCAQPVRTQSIWSKKTTCAILTIPTLAHLSFICLSELERTIMQSESFACCLLLWIADKGPSWGQPPIWLPVACRALDPLHDDPLHGPVLRSASHLLPTSSNLQALAPGRKSRGGVICNLQNFYESPLPRSFSLRHSLRLHRSRRGRHGLRCKLGLQPTSTPPTGCLEAIANNPIKPMPLFLYMIINCDEFLFYHFC